MPLLLTTAVAGAGSDAGMVIVLKMKEGEAVTVTVGAAASAWPCAPAVGATAVVLVATRVGAEGCCDCVGCADCAGWVDCAGCSDCVDCAGPATGLPPTRYFGIGGLAIEVLNPAGSVVCSVSDAGMGLLVAEV
jgi:hypothetical protein